MLFDLKDLVWVVKLLDEANDGRPSRERDIVEGAIAEIERLRAAIVQTRTMAGFREIKDEIRRGPYAAY